MTVRRTHAEYVQILQARGIQIEAVGTYTYNGVKIKHRCKQCGYQWDSRPNDILSGYGCTPCGYKRVGIANGKSHDRYLREVKRQNLMVKRVLGTYVSDGHRIEHEWVCGHTTMCSPTNVLQGSGCRRCAKPYLNTIEYKNWLARNQPNLLCLGSYTGSYAYMLHACKTCGYRWKANAQSVRASGLKGTLGCPVCARPKGRGISQSGTLWLEAEARRRRIKIVPEHRIQFEDGSYCFVDGFNARSRTVFEYYGSAWHGNPKIYVPSDHCHPKNPNVTAGELWQATRARERKLRRAGYYIVSIWDISTLPPRRAA